MKINILSTALAALVGIALISPSANAQTTPSTTTTAPAAPSAPMPDTATKTKEKMKSDYTMYKGTISAMDASSVTVTSSKGEMKLMTDATTKYEVNKKKAASTDFAVGDKVTGSYKTGDDGSMMAHSVHKKAAK